MTSLLRRLAVRAPVPVYAVAGLGARDEVQDLRLSGEITLVDTPRAANVLLVAGSVGAGHAEPLARVHDALPHPRATILWNTDAAGLRIAGAVDLSSASDLAEGIREAFTNLVTGLRRTEGPLLPDAQPIEWRGLGPYGQGGSGMTGGTPYGRPMADLGPDRDGLRLDVVPTFLGPFQYPLPAGLVLDLMMAGDVVVDAAVTGSSIGSPAAMPVPSIFVRALGESVAIAELEVARARDHLRWTADALRVQGLPALGIRALALATRTPPPTGAEVRGFGRRLARTGVFRWSLPTARGRLQPALAGAGLGPVSRSAGVADDARLDDPAYRALGFEVILGTSDDAASRWKLRLEEAARSLELAARAGAARTDVSGVVETPRGRLTAGDAPTSRALEMLPGLVIGLGWGDAIASIISLDLDLSELVGSGQVATVVA
jgi:Respiratory-chain NADH dehydrogenase, 49 Kd subunit